MVSPVSASPGYFFEMPESRDAPGGATDAMRPRPRFSPEEYEALVSGKEGALLETMHAGFDSLYGKLKKEDLFKLLFMERKDLAAGKLAFESKEPNYYSCMLDAYRIMLITFASPLTVDLYRVLHDACCWDLYTEDCPSGVPIGYRVISDGAEAFGLVKDSTFSEAGYRELVHKYKFTVYKYEGDDYFPFKSALVNPETTIDLSGKEVSYIKVKPSRFQTCKFNVQFCLDKYEALPKTNEEEKLIAIATLCQDLDQMHVFVDGNIRTTGILVLNKLLLQQRLSPSVLDDVNCLDCLSVAEIVEKIREGQAYFQALLA